MATLSPVSARLLGLRAGLYGSPALGAPATARTLRVTLAHEQRLEHRALVSLRAAASSTPCADARSTAAAVAAAGSTTGSALGAGTSLPGASRGVTASGGNPARRSLRQHGVTRGAVSRGHSSTGHAPTPTQLANSPTGTTNWALILALVAVAVTGAFALAPEGIQWAYEMDSRHARRRSPRSGGLTASPSALPGARVPPAPLPPTPAPGRSPSRPAARPPAPLIAPPAPGQAASDSAHPAAPTAPDSRR